jgi:formylglycine-generating enzyme required for sulfatase activity
MIGARVLARAAVVAAMLLMAAGVVQAALIDTVPVGNPGNAGELSGAGAGGYGPSVTSGAVAYAYNIGKYEVTASQYTAFLNAVGGVDTYALYNTGMADTSNGSGITRSGGGTVSNPYTYSVAPAFTNRPVNFVSWGDAARFANWLHNGQLTAPQGLTTTEDGAYYLNGATSAAALLAVTRKAGAKWAITSEDEWYKAAYYNPKTGTYFDYPTSSNTAPGQDMADVSGNNANYYTAPYVLPIDSGKYSTVAGEFQNSASPYDTFDQGGNVWEWNEATIYGAYRGVRGGSFYNNDFLLAANRYFFDPTHENYDLGFRVAEVSGNIPEPVSMSLLALGGLGILMRRRGMAR